VAETIESDGHYLAPGVQEQAERKL